MKKLLLMLVTLFSASSQAYYSTMDSAELVKKGEYLLNVETQFITDGNSGANLLGRFDGRLTEDSGYRVELGFGVVDFQVAAFYKWAPIPDVDNQPALAVNAGISIASVDIGAKSATDLSLRAHPIISKSFNVEFGNLTPFASLPIGIRNLNSETDLTAQLAIGSFLKPEKFERMSFALELGFDLSDAFTYFSLGFTLNMDPSDGLVFK